MAKAISAKLAGDYTLYRASRIMQTPALQMLTLVLVLGCAGAGTGADAGAGAGAGVGGIVGHSNGFGVCHLFFVFFLLLFLFYSRS